MSDDNTSVNLQAYTTNGYKAPDHCETCNTSLPDEDSRRQHMNETRHRICPLCDGYVPVGGYYMHCELRHADERWNDHQVAWTDNRDNKESQSWATQGDKKL